MTGATPPCSSATRVPGASNERNFQPTADEPIKLKKATLSSVTSFCATLTSQHMNWAHSGAKPA